MGLRAHRDTRGRGSDCTGCRYGKAVRRQRQLRPLPRGAEGGARTAATERSPRAKPPRTRRGSSPAPSPPPRASALSARIRGSGPPHCQSDVIRRPRSRPALRCSRAYSRPGGRKAASRSCCFGPTTFLKRTRRDFCLLAATWLLPEAVPELPAASRRAVRRSRDAEQKSRGAPPSRPALPSLCSASLGDGQSVSRQGSGSAGQRGPRSASAAGLYGTVPCRPTDGVNRI